MSFLRLESVFSQVTPSDILRLGKGSTHAHCPACRSKSLTSAKGAFYCENKGCLQEPMSALHYGLTQIGLDPGDFIDRSFNIIPERLTGVGAYAVDYISRILKNEAASYVRNAKALKGILQGSPDVRNFDAANYSLLSRLVTNPEYLTGAVYQVPSTALIQFISRMGVVLRDSVKNLQESHRTLLVIPAYSGYSSISGFHLLLPEGKEFKTRFIQVDDTAFHWSGASHIKPDSGSKLVLCRTLPEYLQVATQLKDDLDDTSSAVYLMMPETAVTSSFPEWDSVVLLSSNIEEAPDALKRIKSFGRLVKSVSVGVVDSDGVDTGMRMPLYDFCFNLFQQEFSKKNRITSRVVKVLENYPGPEDLSKRCLEWMEDHGFEDQAKVYKEDSTINRIVRIRDNMIIVTPYGYQTVRKGSDDINLFTNFSLELTEGTFFPVTEDTYYRGFLHTNGKRYPIELSKSDFSKYTSIEAACVQAYKNSLSDTEGSEGVTLPSIIDTSKGGLLPALLTRDAAEVKVRWGCDSLGWDRSFTEFSGPTWMASGGSISRRKIRPHPRRFSLSLLDFNRSIPKPALSEELVGEDAAQLINSIVAQLYRMTTGYAVHPVLLQNTPEGRNLARTVLRPFGWIQPLIVNPNKRGDPNSYLPDEIKMYPSLIMCSNSDKASIIPCSGIAVTTVGLLAQPRSRDTYRNIFNVSSYIFQRVLQAMTRPEGLLQPSDMKSDPLPSELAEEGRRLIRQLPEYKSVWGVESTVPSCIGDYLQGLSSDSLKQILRIDFERQRIVLCTNKHPDRRIKRKELADALKTVDPTVVLHGPHYISCSAADVLPLLTQVIGDRITLGKFQSDLPEETEESAVPEATEAAH